MGGRRCNAVQFASSGSCSSNSIVGRIQCLHVNDDTLSTKITITLHTHTHTHTKFACFT